MAIRIDPKNFFKKKKCRLRGTWTFEVLQEFHLIDEDALKELTKLSIEYLKRKDVQKEEFEKPDPQD